MRVFLDTNVLASALTTRGLCAELFEVVLQSHELLTSDPILHELERILPAKLGQSEEVTQGFINLLQTHVILVTTKHPFPSLPDPDDEPIVASALAGNANVFVTGDKALLQLESIEHLPIISPRKFWEMLAGR
ncbi:MAG: putative toxin-antitoxin system toxin component, PIN family [Gammaproteobacteria bacterium]|nr:MAG: putative toxin-antitoxin system toxin component, PIN family [Gammaproteobacteria bacterium]